MLLLSISYAPFAERYVRDFLLFAFREETVSTEFRALRGLQLHLSPFEGLFPP